MNRRLLVRLVLAAAVCGGAGVAWAQHALEIIPLRHRTAEQVVPVLQPLLEPGGTLSGSRGQLFLRASPANVAEIRRALEAIDRPARRLQILVRLDDAHERSRRALGASGTIGSGGSHVDITAIDSRRSAAERVDQRVQVMEGGRAMIFTGASQPARVQGGTYIQETASGFEVVPRLSGSSVTLEIYQQRETLGPGRTIQGQRIDTAVTARLGEWTEIGGTSSGASADERGIGSAGRAVQSGARRVWVKVEALD
jgi:hypothetical protein